MVIPEEVRITIDLSGDVPVAEVESEPARPCRKSLQSRKWTGSHDMGEGNETIEHLLLFLEERRRGFIPTFEPKCGRFLCDDVDSGFRQSTSPRPQGIVMK